MREDVLDPHLRRSATDLADRLALLGYARTVLGLFVEAQKVLDEAVDLEASQTLQQGPARTNLVLLALLRGAAVECAAQAGNLVEVSPWVVRRPVWLARLALFVSVALIRQGELVAGSLSNFIEETIGEDPAFGSDVEYGLLADFVGRSVATSTLRQTRRRQHPPSRRPARDARPR